MQPDLVSYLPLIAWDTDAVVGSQPQQSTGTLDAEVTLKQYGLHPDSDGFPLDYETVRVSSTLPDYETVWFPVKL